jgi:formate dehydrogenase gamma subunit
MNNQSNQQNHYLRWTKVERWQHWILAISFGVLAVSGFALKYPESWWAFPLVIMEEGFGGRGLLHRVAATAFLALSVFHLGYLGLTRRGREIFRAMLPILRDVRDARENFKYLLGRKVEPPAYDHFSYIEKLEYWALVWGTVVMSVTGLLLWFESVALSFLPLWAMDIMTAIHLYEAWLATLAIFVWHFYAVIFNPEVYPLNTSMVTGLMSEREMALEHGRELARLRKQTTQEVAEPSATETGQRETA